MGAEPRTPEPPDKHELRRRRKTHNPAGAPYGGPGGGRPPDPNATSAASYGAVAINRLCDAVGHEEFREILAFAPDLTAEEAAFMEKLGDHRTNLDRLDKICHELKFPFGKVVALFRKAHAAQAMLQVWKKIYEKVPETVSDVMMRSAPHEVLCRGCWGTGRKKLGPDRVKTVAADGTETLEWQTIPCQECNETGKIPIIPDVKRQETALQVVGLLKTGGSQVNINNTTQNNAVFVPQSTASFRDAMNKILFSTKPPKAIEEAPVEAEVLKAEEPSTTPL